MLPKGSVCYPDAQPEAHRPVSNSCSRHLFRNSSKFAKPDQNHSGHATELIWNGFSLLVHIALKHVSGSILHSQAPSDLPPCSFQPCTYVKPKLHKRPALLTCCPSNKKTGTAQRVMKMLQVPQTFNYSFDQNSIPNDTVNTAMEVPMRSITPWEQFPLKPTFILSKFNISQPSLGRWETVWFVYKLLPFFTAYMIWKMVS